MQVESVIRRRLQVGAVVSERRMREELIKLDFSEMAISRAIYQLLAKETLNYRDKRVTLVRVGQ